MLTYYPLEHLKVSSVKYFALPQYVNAGGYGVIDWWTSKKTKQILFGFDYISIFICCAGVNKNQTKKQRAKIGNITRHVASEL